MGRLTSAAKLLAKGSSLGGRKMGEATSPKKARAARINGTMAGKPAGKKRK